MAAPFILLGLAICAVWIPDLRWRSFRIPPWFLLFIAAVANGLAAAILNPLALLSLGALAAVAWASVQAPSKTVRAALTYTAAVIALLMALHQAPGFNNPKLFEGLRLSADAAAFTQYLNFDKGAAGLILLAIYGRRVRTVGRLRQVAVVVLGVTAGTTAVVSTLGIALGYVQPDLKLPHIALAFLATNLLLTCVAEEAFFRGLLQERLAVGVRNTRWLAWLPLAASSLLFGLAHAAGGLTFVALATVAGLGYSIAYQLTRRVEAAVLTHFLVNAIQFFGFTYPYLAP